jgi:Flp pilus assembly pilin Flp
MSAMQKFLRKGLKRFLKNEEGLVTVEWIALVAAVVVGGIAVVWLVMNQAGGIAQNISASISSTNAAGCGNASNLSSIVGC